MPTTSNPAPETAIVEETNTDSSRTVTKLDTIVGTIRRVNLEGGFWGFFSDDGERYDPTGSLLVALQKEGARVRIVAARRTDVATVRMWGTVVDVVSYELLPDSAK